MSDPGRDPSGEPSPQFAVGDGLPTPSFYRVLQSDTPTNSLFFLPVGLWLCWLLMWGGWLLASIGFDLAGVGPGGVAGLWTAQRWFVFAALAGSAVCVPLLLRRLLVIRGIFANAAGVDGQVVDVPRRAGWKTLIIEYGYCNERYRIGYTVPSASHVDRPADGQHAVPAPLDLVMEGRLGEYCPIWRILACEGLRPAMASPALCP